MIKKLLKKYFESLAYFYSYLKYRIIILMVFSIFMGFLDGVGLSLFLPLLKLVSDDSPANAEDMGNLDFVVDFITGLGFTLDLFTILLFMGIFFMVKGLFQFFTEAYRVKVQEWFIEKLRLRNIEGLNSLDYKYFVTTDAGRIQNTLTGEVERVSSSYKNYFKALEFGVLVLVYMVFAFLMNAQFALLVSAGGLLTNFLYRSFYKNTVAFSKKLTGENNTFQRLIIQNVTNYKYLKATGSLKDYQQKLENSVAEIKKSNVKIGFLDALLVSTREPILIVVVVSVIWIQTTFLSSNLASILISLLFFYRALNYLMQMQLRYNQFLGLSGSLQNMTFFGRELESNKESWSGNEEFQSIRKLELKNVFFNYGETPILSGVDLTIKRYETVAFVGESGSGKSTLVNIVSGLLPIDAGSFKVNDKPIFHLNIRSYQSQIGYITQDPVIFNDTLFNNVTFWSPKTVNIQKRFQKAIEQAAISDFINELPEGENTLLGNNGVNLSGGQKQRISIARELFKQVEILILDEATSALDSETEKMIQDNIEALKGNITILIVAHRISTIKNADRIVVMKDGRISKINDFSNLMKESSDFKRLVELQDVQGSSSKKESL